MLIGAPGLGPIDITLAQRIYSGRAIAIGETPVTPLNLPPGHAVRQAFMDAVMQQPDDKYIAYWTVRRHVGKGTPPRELASAAEVIAFVQRTPGAIGYIPASALRPEMNLLLRP
ncbi:MAG: hypothetical protein Q8N44_13625 [Rubrivivax sp.]|nr:hypothetical protein [Rubrivivax sp.]